ncbi:hypothetical protein Tco_1457890 [Tanacetum coccineum]
MEQRVKGRAKQTPTVKAYKVKTDIKKWSISQLEIVHYGKVQGAKPTDASATSETTSNTTFDAGDAATASNEVQGGINPQYGSGPVLGAPKEEGGIGDMAAATFFCKRSTLRGEWLSLLQHSSER